MYESFFGLRERPFAAAPHVERYFPAASIEGARQTLIRCIERAEGAALVVGPAGVGKTLLCQALAEQLRPRFEIALLDSGRLCTRRALLQAILFELGLPYRGMEEGELRLSLIDHLSPREPQTQGLVLLIDEAHALPLRLLEELRMITNLVRGGQPRVRLLLCGGPMLEERFASPKLESFNQRLAARCYLDALDRNETINYVRAQITAVGGVPDRIFTYDALEAVYRATDGIPRLINQVCDHALILACAGGASLVHKHGIEEAWSDLQQLPAPWAASTAPTRSTAIVEFGSLDEAPATEDAAAEEAAALPFAPASAALHSVVETPADLRLDAIEQQLSALQESYEAPTSIGPEVDLIFSGATDPFHEQFDEEEVIIDRFAAMDIRRPIVSSSEGRALSAMLAPLTSRPSFTVTDVVEAEIEPAAEPHEEHEEVEEFIVAQTLQMAEASAPSVDDEAPAAQVAVAEEVEAEIIARASTPEEADTFADVAPDDEDLILVEDDAHDGPVRAVTPAVRRQEYRQLFARLRRG